jgi:hypothetical protein
MVSAGRPITLIKNMYCIIGVPTMKKRRIERIEEMILENVGSR